jgi:hypothetical protein
MSSDTLPPQGRQRFVRIKDVDVVSRAKLYQLAPQHPGLFKKLDHITIVDLDVFDEILAACPPAAIKPRAEPTDTSPKRRVGRPRRKVADADAQ